jgi:uncharacterized membrane protein
MNRIVNAQQLARGLGWFSIGLGLAHLAAPRRMSRMIGVESHPLLLRAIGLRELATGVGILSERKPAAWVEARVAGDMMDLALLGGALTVGGRNGGSRARVAAATAAVAGVAALDLLTAEQLERSAGAETIHLRRSITVNRPADELYRYWRNFENLPRFMKNLESVRVTGPNRTHWVAKGPADVKLEWDAEIIDDRPDQRIAWRSLEGADVENWGSVTFEAAPGGRGTIVHVEMGYNPPGGALGAKVAKLFGKSPEQQTYVELRAFKQLLETGEIPTTEGQPSGRSTSLVKAAERVMQA